MEIVRAWVALVSHPDVEANASIVSLVETIIDLPNVHDDVLFLVSFVMMCRPRACLALAFSEHSNSDNDVWNRLFDKLKPSLEIAVFSESAVRLFAPLPITIPMDVELVVGSDGNTGFAHMFANRGMLCAVSPYARTALESNLFRKSQHLELPSLSVRGVDVVLRWLCDAHTPPAIHNSVDAGKEAYMAADFLGIEHLCGLLEVCLCNLVSRETIISLTAFAVKSNLRFLRLVVCRFTLHHPTYPECMATLPLAATTLEWFVRGE